MLTEAEPGVVQTNSAEVVMEVGCFAHRVGPYSNATANKTGAKPTRLSLGEGGPNGAGVNEQFELPEGGNPVVTCITDETHLWRPRWVSGTDFGSNTPVNFPSKAHQASIFHVRVVHSKDSCENP